MYYKFSFTIDFVFYSLLSSLLIIIGFIDLKEMIIPDVLVIGILVLTLIYKGVNYLLYGITANLLYSLGGMFIAGGMFLAILILSGGGMGDGVRHNDLILPFGIGKLPV